MTTPAFDPLLGGTSIVALANDWTADPTSKHQVMRRLSETNPVLWVEAAGMRTPNLVSAADRARLLSKARAIVRRSRQVLPRVHVIAPPALPFPRSPAVQALNGALYRFTIRRELRRLSLDAEPLVCAFAPQCAPYLRGFPRRFLLYYCVDRWSAFDDYDAATMERSEEELCREADLVIASAEDLAARCRRFSSNVHYVPHGVDHAHFGQALTPGNLPEELASIPEPRVGFFGLIHEWVDTDLIARLADALPYSFVLIGSAKGPIEALTGRANVHLLGRRPYNVLPDYCRGFQAALVPFRMTALTNSVNPIKLREYAAAGLPIVSSPLPEVLKCSDIAVCADSLDTWVEAVRDAVGHGRDPAWRIAQSARVRNDDWSERCRIISALVNGTPRGEEARGVARPVGEAAWQ